MFCSTKLVRSFVFKDKLSKLETSFLCLLMEDEGIAVVAFSRVKCDHEGKMKGFQSMALLRDLHQSPPCVRYMHSEVNF